MPHGENTEDQGAREAAAEIPGVRPEVLESAELLTDLLSERDEERGVQEENSEQRQITGDANCLRGVEPKLDRVAGEQCMSRDCQRSEEHTSELQSQSNLV